MIMLPRTFREYLFTFRGPSANTSKRNPQKQVSVLVNKKLWLLLLLLLLSGWLPLAAGWVLGYWQLLVGWLLAAGRCLLLTAGC